MKLQDLQEIGFLNSRGGSNEKSGGGPLGQDAPLGLLGDPQTS